MAIAKHDIDLTVMAFRRKTKFLQIIQMFASEKNAACETFADGHHITRNSHFRFLIAANKLEFEIKRPPKPCALLRISPADAPDSLYP